MRGWVQGTDPNAFADFLRGLVPSTLSAYCKQQIKWAFGSVELLFQVYPKVFGGMTWWQRLHYVMAVVAPALAVSMMLTKAPARGPDWMATASSCMGT